MTIMIKCTACGEEEVVAIRHDEEMAREAFTKTLYRLRMDDVPPCRECGQIDLEVQLRNIYGETVRRAVV